jgi:co-chaperonin GroES (HSP10)
MKAITDNLIVRKIKASNETKTGIIVTTKKVNEENMAEVISVGEQITDIVVGNLVLICPYAGKDIDEQLTSLNYYDVLAILL